MRIILGVVVAAASLAACQSEDQVKERYKQEAAASCATQMAARGPAAPGLDVTRFCNCLAERTVAGRSVSELESLNSQAGAAVGQEAGAHCMAEQLGGAAAAPAANAAQPAADAAVNEAGSEAVQDAAENEE